MATPEKLWWTDDQVTCEGGPSPNTDLEPEVALLWSCDQSADEGSSQRASVRSALLMETGPGPGFSGELVLAVLEAEVLVSWRHT